MSESLLNIVRRLSDMAPDSAGLGGHAPLMAFTELAIQARRVLECQVHQDFENTLKTIQEISSPKDRSDRTEPWVLLDIINDLARRAVKEKQ